MTQVFISNLARDGEKRPFKAHGHALVGSAGAATFMKGTFEPGWRWSRDVKPIAGTESCQTRHLGYTILRIKRPFRRAAKVTIALPFI